MKNKQLYQDTFDSIEMSEEALRKVRDMSEKNKKIGRRTGLRVAATVAAVVLALGLGNGAVYAATGSAPVTEVAEKVINGVSVYVNDRVSVYVNGKRIDEAEDSVVTAYEDEQGHTHIEMSEGSSDTESVIEYDSKALKDENISIVEDIQVEDGKSYVHTMLISGKLKQKGDKVFLMVGDNQKTIDITEDFADGDAKGKVEIKGKIYRYQVSGTVEDYDVKFSLAQE